MIEQRYNFTPSGQSISQGQGTPQRSQRTYDIRGGVVETPKWTPNDAPEIHDEPFKHGDGSPSTGDLPENIEGGGDFDVDADFDQGGSDGYTEDDFGPVPDNIIV